MSMEELAQTRAHLRAKLILISPVNERFLFSIMNQAVVNLCVNSKRCSYEFACY